jgi:hypothetical protein
MSRLKAGSAEFIPLSLGHEVSPWAALHDVPRREIQQWMRIPRTVVCRNDEDVMLIARMRVEHYLVYPWLRTITICINELALDEAKVVIGSDYQTVADWARSFGCDIQDTHPARNTRAEMHTGVRYNPWLHAVEALDEDKFQAFKQSLPQSQGRGRAEFPSQLHLPL